MRISYTGAVNDLSGYSEAARNNICALSHVGVDVDVLPVSFERFRSDLGILGKKIKPMVKSESNAHINIVHATPNLYEQLMTKNAYNIGYTAWETNKLPPKWVPELNKMNEIWVPSKWNVEVFKGSGVNVPVHLIPHAMNYDVIQKDKGNITSPVLNSNPDEFNFYSIFQFTERKGPSSLLKAYLTEFKPHEKVCLILKTYLITPGDPNEKERIKNQIATIKKRLYLYNYPKILLVSSKLSRSEIYSLHDSSDCYVSLHRDEGFGLPVAEAMMAGKPVICTDHGGPQDFVTQETGFPIEWQPTPVYGMPWENYQGDQWWADVNIMKVKEKMRYLFENKGVAKEVGNKGQQFIKIYCSWDRVGSLMKQRLEEISRR